MAQSAGLAMSWDEWGKHDATALAALVRKRAITPREVVRQAARAVELVNPRLAGVLEVYEDVLDRPGVDGPARDGALYGVPLFLKDLGSGLRGRRQESGSKLYRGHVMPATDPTVTNYLAAGLIPIGRSTTPEFGMTFDTATDYLGRVLVTRNPWNPERTPGGSSGGSAAMVAAGVTPLSMSSDGGGSTRIPASFCGLVGLKATRGRVPRPLVQSEYMTRISIDGVVTRTVRDTAAVYDYLTRIPSGGAFIHMGPPVGSYLRALRRPPGRLTIGLSTGAWGRGGRPDTEWPRASARWAGSWRAWVTGWRRSPIGHSATGRPCGRPTSPSGSDRGRSSPPRLGTGASPPRRSPSTWAPWSIATTSRRAATTSSTSGG